VSVATACNRHFLLFIYFIVGFCLGEDDLLLMVKAVMTGDHIADGDGHKIIGHSFKSEEFKGDEQRSNGTVGDTAE
jgi:hypothetical protein